MSIIDSEIEQINAFNNRNFKVDAKHLASFTDLFDLYDDEIVSAPFVEYTEDNLPPYLPDMSKGALN